MTKKLIWCLNLTFFYKPSTFICRGNGFRRRRRKPLFSRNPRIRTDGIVHVRSRDLHLLRKVAWSKLWYHLLRQHRSGHVDGFPMCQHGGLDSRSVFGKLLSFFQSFSSAAWRGAAHYAWSHSRWWRGRRRGAADHQRMQWQPKSYIFGTAESVLVRRCSGLEKAAAPSQLLASNDGLRTYNV